jgi:carbon starvation protein
MCAIFMAVVISMLVYGVLSIRRALAAPVATTREVGREPVLRPV